MSLRLPATPMSACQGTRLHGNSFTAFSFPFLLESFSTHVRCPRELAGWLTANQLYKSVSACLELKVLSYSEEYLFVLFVFYSCSKTRYNLLL